MAVCSSPEGEQQHSLEAFFRENQWFLLPWVCLAAVQIAIFNIPSVAAWCDAQGLEPLGMRAAIHLAIFGLLMQFAVHGLCTVFHDKWESKGLKIQNKPYPFQAEEAMMRSSLILMVSMTAYAATPMKSGSASLLEVFIGYSLLLIIHDAWFYMVHRAAHTKNFYALIHKTHHKWKQPMAFAAYYIRSPSQMLQEHACLIPCMLFLPVPMYSFLLYQYIGAPLSMLEHCGFRVGDLNLPILGLLDIPYLGHLKVEHLSTLLGGGWSLILGSQSVENHDYHHLNFQGNYGLSYNYLDKLLGTYIEEKDSEPALSTSLLQA